MLRPGSTWKCPSCGTENTAYSYTSDMCRGCKFVARSYTNYLNLLLASYQHKRIEFEETWDYKKGRRKFKPNRIEGDFLGLTHSPDIGFMLVALLKKKNGKPLRNSRGEKFVFRIKVPLRNILPWGKDLENLIISPEILRRALSGNLQLPNISPLQLTSPEQELVKSC